MLFVDGIEYSFDDCFQTGGIGGLKGDTNGNETHWNFINLNGDDIRVRIEADPTKMNELDQGWVLNRNPTLHVDFGTGVIEFCLIGTNSL